MTIRADVDNKFIRRFLFLAIGCFLFMLWGLYDGLVTSPREVERAKAYKELEEKSESGLITEEARAEQWQRLAKEKNWALAQPKSIKVAQNYVYFQWFVFALGLVLGFFFLIKFLKLRGSWMEADGSGVQTSWGRSLNFKDVQRVNKSKWLKKGIAKIYYSDESGGDATMVFDDFKYNRAAMSEIMTSLEANLSDSQIEGAPRQTEIESDKEKADGKPDEAN